VSGDDGVDRWKAAAADTIGMVEDGMIVGSGNGSTEGSVIDGILIRTAAPRPS
jgi:ribose 5-phosphate isomerase